LKSVKDIEKTRREYHSDVSLNSVHHASLLVAELPNCKASISFLNHFLVKRGYQHVACRVTSLDREGNRLLTKLHDVNKAKVYNISLTETVGEAAHSHIIEFFSADNLFIPFPAVVINYQGDSFFNMVHAYNRVLNDVFEDDVINATLVAEASLDVEINENTDTFVLFSAGQQAVEGTIEIELSTPNFVKHESLSMNVPRFGHELIKLGKYAEQNVTGGVLKVRPPKQSMFYGRMFSGRMSNDGSFSGNHSFYDSSNVEEYWSNGKASSRLYPFDAEAKNIVRIYPIMSPSELEFSIEFLGLNGLVLGVSKIGCLKSPSTQFMDICVNDFLLSSGLSVQNIGAFHLSAKPLSGNTPTRINHQLVYSMGGLDCSLNVSLVSPNLFQPKAKKGFSWGQIPLSHKMDSVLHILMQVPQPEPVDLTVTLYGSAGIASKELKTLVGGQCLTIRSPELLDMFGTDFDPEVPGNHWFTVSSEFPSLTAYTVVVDRLSGHATGEHSF
jgi:hypothetical protein